MQGKVHTFCIMAISDRSRTRSLIHVIPRSVRQPIAVLGIVRRFVSNCSIRQFTWQIREVGVSMAYRIETNVSQRQC